MGIPGDHSEANLLHPRSPRIRGRVDHVDAAGAEGRDDETGSRPAGIVVAARARVPARVVNLVADVRHWETVNYLKWSQVLRIGWVSKDGSLKCN